MFNVNGQNYKLANRYNFTAQSQALFDRATALGYSLPSETKRRQIDTLIRSLVSSGIWDKLDLFFQFAYNDTSLNDFSKINWKRPLSPVAVSNGGVTFTANGWLGNGVDGFISTNFNPAIQSNNYSLNNASRGFVIYQEYTGTIANSFIDGVASGNDNRSLNASNIGQRINQGTNLLDSSASLGGTGLKAIMRTSSTNVSFYNTGTLDGRTATSTALPNENLLILRVANSYGNLGISNYFLGSSLTLTELNTLKSAYNSFLNNNGLTQFA